MHTIDVNTLVQAIHAVNQAGKGCITLSEGLTVEHTGRKVLINYGVENRNGFGISPSEIQLIPKIGIERS